jgi:hypothetical protein
VGTKKDAYDDAMEKKYSINFFVLNAFLKTCVNGHIYSDNHFRKGIRSIFICRVFFLKQANPLLRGEGEVLYLIRFS